jgi:hypothetical protein
LPSRGDTIIAPMISRRPMIGSRVSVQPPAMIGHLVFRAAAGGFVLFVFVFFLFFFFIWLGFSAQRCYLHPQVFTSLLYLHPPKKWLNYFFSLFQKALIWPVAYLSYFGHFYCAKIFLHDCSTYFMF